MRAYVHFNTCIKRLGNTSLSLWKRAFRGNFQVHATNTPGKKKPKKKRSSCLRALCHTLAHNAPPPLSHTHTPLLLASKWGRFSDRAHTFLLKVAQAFASRWRKGATISICEREKRWRLLAGQTGVILLAALLLFLSSYLISVPL